MTICQNNCPVRFKRSSTDPYVGQRSSDFNQTDLHSTQGSTSYNLNSVHRTYPVLSTITDLDKDPTEHASVYMAKSMSIRR
ncbi:hypothetical protein CHS0354_023651, partial [Potamilus streckersoni]